MKRIQPLTKLPEYGATVSPDVKITFIITVLQASVPLFTNKNAQNPVETPDGTTTEGEGEA